MKISIESAVAGYMNKINTGVKSKQSVSVSENGRNFDQIMISSNSRKAAEEQLKTAAKKDVAAAVYQQDATDKIATLKEQVSQGMYKVDPEAVASKILLWGGNQ